MYAAASKLNVELVPGWVDPSKPSTLRYNVLHTAYPPYTWGTHWTIWDLDAVYARATQQLIPRVRDAAVLWAKRVLDEQEIEVGKVAIAADKDRQRIHGAAREVRKDYDTVWMSGSGMTSEEAHAVLEGRRGQVFDRLRRAGYMRLVRERKDPVLFRMMAHPKGVAIIDEFADSADGGFAFTTELIEQSVEAMRDMTDSLNDPAAVWRFPPAVSAGAALLGRPRSAITGFALQWAQVEGYRLERALDIAGNAIFALQLVGGPLGTAIGEVLDFILSVTGAAVAFLRDTEQDQAGKATAFAEDAERLSSGSNYLGTALAGAAAIVAAVALPGALSEIARHAGVGTKKLVAAAEHAPGRHEILDARGVNERGIAREQAQDAGERLTSDTSRGTAHTATAADSATAAKREAALAQGTRSESKSASKIVTVDETARATTPPATKKTVTADDLARDTAQRGESATSTLARGTDHKLSAVRPHMDEAMTAAEAAGKGVARPQLWGKYKVGPAYATMEDAIKHLPHSQAHMAQVVYKDAKGNIVATWWEVSEAGAGLPAQVSHTEQKALVRVQLRPGETLEIRGWHPPCPYKSGCHLVMEHTAIESGANIYYFGVKNGSMDERVYAGGEGYLPRGR